MFPSRKETMKKLKCNSCKYRTKTENMTCCNYILVTGHMRQSPFGNKCEKYMRGKQAQSLDSVKGKCLDRNRPKVKKGNGNVSPIIVTMMDGSKVRFESKKQFADFLGKHSTTVIKALKRSEKDGSYEVFGHKWKVAERNGNTAEKAEK